MTDLSTEYQLTWKREERDGRSYWHIYDRAGNRVRNIIGIEGQLIDEIERVYKALAKANANHEHFEREWYLRGDEIERLRTAIDQVHQARLTWAMVCECTCKSCDEFYEFVRDTLPDDSAPDVPSDESVNWECEKCKSLTAVMLTKCYCCGNPRPVTRPVTTNGE